MNKLAGIKKYFVGKNENKKAEQIESFMNNYAGDFVNILANGRMNYDVEKRAGENKCFVNN